VLCVDPTRGTFRWAIDLVRDYGTRVPDWYAGQCPLIEDGRAIIAPAGNAMMIAVNCADGNVIWKTPNPKGWRMSHSSVVPMEFAGRRMYVYCANEGVVGVDSRDGRILWQTPEVPDKEQAKQTAAWAIEPTVVPSPVPLEGGRIFLSGGYGAGSKMIRLRQQGEKITPELVFQLPPEVFGAKQQTPIFYRGHLYGMRPGGEMVCLDLNGNVLWAGGQFGDGYGPYVLAGGMLYVMNDDGVLALLRATPEAYDELDRAKVLEGPDSWGPMAVVAGRLVARDLNRMICLDIRAK
jgi:outer membrane protein assembly factor BamB